MKPVRPIDANALLDIYESPAYRTTIHSMQFIDSIIKAPTIGMFSCWIPCVKELPKQAGEYLCTVQTYGTDTGEVIDAYINFCDFMDGDWCVPDNETVIAWMRMPEIYKESRQ